MSFGSAVVAFSKRHAPEILTGAACVGVGLTSFFASKATLEAHEIMARNDIYNSSFKDKDSDGRKEELQHFVRYIAPAYIPALISGAATIGCMVYAHKLDINKIKAMASICTASTTALESYKQTIAEIVGEKKAGEIAQNVVQKKLDANPASQNEIVPVVEGSESLWYDENSGRYFYATMEYMRRAEADLKNDLFVDDIVTQNDIYDRIGLDEVKLGDDVGFDIKRGDRVIFVYDTAMSDDDRPMCTVAFPVKPIF